MKANAAATMRICVRRLWEANRLGVTSRARALFVSSGPSKIPNDIINGILEPVDTARTLTYGPPFARAVALALIVLVGWVHPFKVDPARCVQT